MRLEDQRGCPFRQVSVVALKGPAQRRLQARKQRTHGYVHTRMSVGSATSTGACGAAHSFGRDVIEACKSMRLPAGVSIRATLTDVFSPKRPTAKKIETRPSTRTNM